MSSTVTSVLARRGRVTKAVHPASLTSLPPPVSCDHRWLQARGFRFGRLSSYFIHYISPDVYSRGKPSGYNKYCENLYRHHFSHPHSFTEEAKATLDRLYKSYWSTSPGGSQDPEKRPNREASPQRTPDNPTGVRPGQNIEDAERAPLEHFLFGDQKDGSAKKESPSNESPASPTPKADETEYVIDPITLRKVPRTLFESGYHLSDQGAEPTKPSAAYKPQFEAFWAPETEETKRDVSPGSGDKKTGQAIGQDKASAGEEHEWLYKPSDFSNQKQQRQVDNPPNEHREAYQTTTSDNHTPVSSSTKAELQRDYDPLPRNPPPINNKGAETTTKTADDLERYRKPYFASEPNGKYAANGNWPEYSQDELGKYRHPFFSFEPDGRYAPSFTQSPSSKEELSKYQAVRSHEPDGKYAAEAQAPAQGAKDAENHEAYGYDETETKWLSEKIQQGISDTETAESSKHDKTESQDSFSGLDKSYSEELQESQKQTKEDNYSIGSANNRCPEQEHSRSGAKKLFNSIHGTVESSAPTESLSATEGSIPAPATKRRLTGNYIEDFPEDFSKSWTDELSNTKSSDPVSEQNSSASDPLQPALDRLTTTTAAAATTNHKPTKTTQKKTTPNSPAAEPAILTSSPSPPSNQLTIYKVLAYDPTTQSIHTAETTSSIIPSYKRDTALPTPVKILLQLSHPAKFIPHLDSLCNQGFEIVGGKGDILIFRKVREGSGGASPAAATEGTGDGQLSGVSAGGGRGGGGGATINPIDMTGQKRRWFSDKGAVHEDDGYDVSALRFSSPTGFVNYYDLAGAGVGGGQHGLRGNGQEGSGSGGQTRSQQGRGGEASAEEDLRGQRRSNSTSNWPRRVGLGLASLFGGVYAIGAVSEYSRKREETTWEGFKKA
ncbi:hypothetical protein VTJ04DRAFT_5327 [Mycothermus thermophilus]|uniref:uncharacterized protein n=1 Tax=Humicola insolens TaxID=85995 RepID=UPI0037426010